MRKLLYEERGVCMTIRVKRKTGFVGMLRKYWIYINGRKNKKIAHNEQVEVPVLEENATLQVKQFGERSNEIQVSSGDIVEVQRTFIGRYALFIIFLINLLSHIFLLFIDNSAMKTFILGVSLTLIIILVIVIFTPGANLKSIKFTHLIMKMIELKTNGLHKLRAKKIGDGCLIFALLFHFFYL